MKKIHSFFAVFVGSLSLLVFLLLLILFYNFQADRVNSLAFESNLLLTDWNSLENESNDLLLKRFTQFGSENSPLIDAWEEHYREFGIKLERLMENPQIKRQPETAERLAGAYRIWRFTEVRLNNARYYFNRIIQSGLGEKVMVNGLLHTMYQLRMEGLLDVDEISLLEELVYALENLDNATEEFESLFSSIIKDMRVEGQTHLKRIRGLFVGLFSSTVLVFFISLGINRQLKTAHQNRRVYNAARKEERLRSLCLNSSEEELLQFREKAPELGMNISIERPVLIILLQIDDYQRLSHEFNLAEQEHRIAGVSGDLSDRLERAGYPSEFFRFRGEYIVFMINMESEEDPSDFKTLLREWYSGLDERLSLSVSVTTSDICIDNQDLDRDFEYVQKLADYRYLVGRKAFIFPGSWAYRPEEPFHYPLERERLFEEAFKSLNIEDTLEILGEMIEYAEPYGPEPVRRLIIRLTASISSVLELLERSYHVSVSTGVTPMILAVQKVETLGEARSMLSGIIEQMIAACRQMKTAKHDQTVTLIREMVDRELGNFNLSADLIADRFNLTTSYINRLFKQHTTLSIAGYINECRLARAQELLKSSEQTVAHIAELSGFASMGTFFRLFKKKFGQTPGEMAAGRAGEASTP